MSNRWIVKIANLLGYEIVKKGKTAAHLGYEHEDEARDAARTVRAHTMLPLPRLVTLYQQVVFCEEQGIAGGYVECGTWKGGAVGLMAIANLRHGRDRRHLHLFDSFEGIPEPDERIDGARALREVRSIGGGTSGRLAPVGNFYETFAGGPGTLDDNRRLLEDVIGYDPGHLHYHKGWFQDTLPRDASDVGPVAILRLDGDWYASTLVCLEFLYGNVVPGGFVIVDDYGCYEGCRKAVDEFMRRERVGAFLHHVDDEARYWIKPAR